MKKFRKIMALALVLAMGLPLYGCSEENNKNTEAPDTKTEEASSASTEETAEMEMPSEDGETIYVYSWNEEAGERLKYFKEAYPQYAERVEFVNLGLEGDSDEYKVAIETLLQAGYNGTDKYPSIIAADTGWELEYVQSDYTVSLDAIGIGEEDTKNMYQYTKDYASFDGKTKALTWQASPGCFLYRTDMAEEIIGAADPESVQEAVADWDKFIELADKMKAAGYKMLSGLDDIKNPMLAQKKLPWVTDEKMNVDPVITDYLETSKKLHDGDYTNKTTVGDTKWESSFDGDVFGWFVSPQFIFRGINAEMHIGEFNVCQGPAVYACESTYLNVAKGCPDMPLAALVLKTLCCDEEVMTRIAEDTGDFVNNKTVMSKISDEGKGSLEMLGEQDPTAIWMKTAESLDLSNVSIFDERFNGYLDRASAAYNSGELESAEDAVELIKDYVTEAYNYITVE